MSTPTDFRPNFETRHYLDFFKACRLYPEKAFAFPHPMACWLMEKLPLYVVCRLETVLNSPELDSDGLADALRAPFCHAPPSIETATQVLAECSLHHEIWRRRREEAASVLADLAAHIRGMSSPAPPPTPA